MCLVQVKQVTMLAHSICTSCLHADLRINPSHNFNFLLQNTSKWPWGPPKQSNQALSVQIKDHRLVAHHRISRTTYFDIEFALRRSREKSSQLQGHFVIRRVDQPLTATANGYRLRWTVSTRFRRLRWKFFTNKGTTMIITRRRLQSLRRGLGKQDYGLVRRGRGIARIGVWFGFRRQVRFGFRRRHRNQRRSAFNQLYDLLLASLLHQL